MPSAALFQVEIREADRTDALALFDLIEQHAAFERASANCTREGLVKALLADPRRLHCWIAREGGRAVGYATAAREFSTWSCGEFLHMDCLFVEPASRGRGIGRLLLGAVRQSALEAGLGRLEWQTPAWNEGAIRFYERAGAVAALRMRFHLSC